MPATAVIVGLEANGLGVARPLARAGIPCIGVTPAGRNPSTRTKSSRVVYCEWNQEGLLAALCKVGAELGEKAALFLTKDEAVLWVSQARRQLEPFFYFNLPDPHVVDLLMNKAAFHGLSVAEGWPTPRSWLLHNRDELAARCKEIPYPSILKPAVKNSAFRAAAPRKAFQASSAEELLAHYDMVARWEPEVVVQEWIEGGDDRVSFCLTYCDHGGRPSAVFAGRKLRQWPIECGNTAIAEPAPEAWAQAIVPLTERIWQRVGYHGLGSVEFKMRPGTDEPVIMEPTVGRTNYQNEVAVLNGVNIPLIAYCDLVGLSLPPATPARRPVKLVDGGNELRAAWQYFRSGRLTLRQWLRDRRGKKKYMLLRLRDPGPFLAASLSGFRDHVAAGLEAVLGPRVRSMVGSTLRAVRGALRSRP